MRLLFDTESDGLLETATKIHCGAAVDVDTGYCADWTDIGSTLSAFDKADTLIGHNILRHDLPLLKKLRNWSPRPGVKIIDTLICARVMYPNVAETDKALVFTGRMPHGKEYQGKHTLGAWGYRLGRHKGDYAKIKEAEAISKGVTDPDAISRYVWGEWNQEMHDYMIQDVQTNRALWDKLCVDKYDQRCIELEHRIARVCDELEAAGVPFNEKAAQELHCDLIAKKDVIEKNISRQFGMWVAPAQPGKVFTPKRDSAKSGYVAGAPMTKIKYVTFNPRSRDHIAKVLFDRGWKPEKFTDGGKAKIDEEVVLDIVSHFPEMSGLGDYLTIEKRLSQLAEGKQAWLKCVRNGRIHGAVNPAGTITGRAAHLKPNLGQVPNPASPYGAECRSLFYAPAGQTIVGVDMRGLELRVLAHYLYPMDGGRYAEIILTSDPHWAHAQAMGLASGPWDESNPIHKIVRQDGSKRFIYAYIYGAGNRKVGEIIFTCVEKIRAKGDDTLLKEFFPRGWSEAALVRVGRKVRSDFTNSIDGFAALKGKLDTQVDRFGWLPGLDGRRIPIRSAHSALNFLLQSGGAVLCKNWVCNVRDAIKFPIGLWVHDEIQLWTPEEEAEEVKETTLKLASTAGEPYGFRVRLDGSATIGRTWADTH